MIYLTLALWAEGTSDGPFLRPLLRRVVIEHALRGPKTIDVAGEFIRLPDPSPDVERDKRISAAVAKRKGEISLLFIHTDGKGRPERARDNNVNPAIRLVSQLPSPPRCVAVVPKHETEAWMLADRDALGKALGVVPEQLIGVPDLDAVERHNDPKQCINEIRSGARRGNRRLPLLDSRQIGEAANLDRLRHLSSFREFESELLSVMRDLQLI